MSNVPLALWDLCLSHSWQPAAYLGHSTLMLTLGLLWQEELAVHLDRLGHLISATPETLAQAVRGLDTSKLNPYPKGSPQGIADAIHRIMAF